jgi:hypothetical protein
MYNLKNILFSFLTVILIASCKPGTSYTSLPPSTPESEGVSSEAILNFVEAADKEVKEKLSTLALPIYRKMDSSTLEKDISGKTYLVQSNENHINSIKLDFKESLLKIRIITKRPAMLS